LSISRRDFLKIAGGAVAGVAAASPDGKDAAVDSPELRTKGAKTTTTICTFCAVGCGMLVQVKDGKVINIEGDPDHPINRGTLCSKGDALFQIPNSDLRLKTVKYRAAGASAWEEKSWDWALDRIAVLMKDSRERKFRVSEKGKDGRDYLVNRNEGMTILGGAGLDNEECYLLSKFARSSGVVYLEHQARL
jgi:anaerobic selenocysteine-containing dehydrogenase